MKQGRTKQTVQKLGALLFTAFMASACVTTQDPPAPVNPMDQARANVHEYDERNRSNARLIAFETHVAYLHSDQATPEERAAFQQDLLRHLEDSIRDGKIDMTQANVLSQQYAGQSYQELYEDVRVTSQNTITTPDGRRVSVFTLDINPQ